MPAKLMPGTPSISAGTMMPCQWMLDISLRPLRTRSVTVSPSRRRRTGAGTLPFTAVAIRRLPVKLTGSSAISRSNSVPLSSAGKVGADRARSAGAKPATAPPIASPWTKRRRAIGRICKGDMNCTFAKSASGEVEDDPALDVAMMHAGEDVVDVLEPVRMDRGLDLALAGERQCLEQIEPRANDRAAHGNAVQHGVEDRQREVARRQAVERDRAAAPDHAERLLERLGRNGGHQRPVRAANGFLERCRRVLVARVDRQCGAKACSEVELAIVDVDRGHIETHGSGILHRHVAEPANAGDDHPLAGSGLGGLQSLVDGDA